ncbi:hypothetical protein HAX54_025292 [Datura stramonium]|uniref:Uncharacterized protein n=1 Tax=Datura stramonium TaxID=4076 RepID=A0ABS8S6B4_DATST|nr:hypothetical protein [Datura stramonium]
MEFEQHILREENKKNYNIETSSSTASSVASHDDFRNRIESFHAREHGVSKSSYSSEKKLSWLRSQIIGANVDFETPFGKRRLTYADHTASGRCLHYIENYIIDSGYSGVKPGWTRVSFPYYMSKEEFVFILEAVEFISIYGQRFLPLYHFNWRNGAWTFKKKAFNCNFCCSQMTKVLRIGFHDTKENNHGGGSTTNQGLVYKYVKYLETAKRIANLLPMFPPQRPIPEEIDPNLVPFRV